MADGNRTSHGNGAEGAPTVGIAARPQDDGYWLLTADGQVTPFGNAPTLGSVQGSSLAVGLVAAPDGKGYWVLTADGTVTPFGDVRTFPLNGGQAVTTAAVAMARTADGMGYWVLGSGGQIAAYGDAIAYGQAQSNDDSFVALCGTPDSKGYWAVTSKGALSAFGDAADLASSSVPATATISAMLVTTSGQGYGLVGTDGTVYSTGDFPTYDPPSQRPSNAAPIVAASF